MSAGEIVIILFVYLLLFGAKGVPALAQTMGKALYQFRNAAKDVQDEIMSSANEIRNEARTRLDQMNLDLEEEHPQTKADFIPSNKPKITPDQPPVVEPAPAVENKSPENPVSAEDNGKAE
jgi:sec-independent protein translocase protein TatA